MRKPLITANWKMNNTVPESLRFVAAFTAELKTAGGVDVAIAPPFTALYSIGVALAETDFRLAAQNIFWEDSGAYTGEVSGVFLKDVGCTYAIVGHSERRQYFGETDETVSRRLAAALRHDMVPILCVGERLEEREAGRTWEIIERQLAGGLTGIDLRNARDFVIAYEPVWAIGTGRNATPEQAEEVHGLVRKYLREKYGEATADRTRILYGGSVKPSNSRELLTKPDIDGALVGGASLDPKHFAAIVRSAH
jgi:triosephosphate isomerase